MNYPLRRQKLYDLLPSKGHLFLCSGFEIHCSADEAYPFVVNRNFYYLTGINQQDSFLVVDLSSREETLYILDNDYKLARWIGYYLTHEEAKEISGINNIKSSSDFDDLYHSVFKNDVIYMDLEKNPYIGGINYGEHFSSIARSINEKVVIDNVYDRIISLRAIKDEDEIELIKKAINITRLSLEAVMKKLPSLKNEREAHALFEERIRSLGYCTPAFTTIAGSDKNAATLHYHANNQDFKNDSIILMDLGARTELYNADITRVYPVNGKFTDLQKSIYSIVLKANKEVEKAAKAGVSLNDLQDLTIKTLANGCLEAGLIKSFDEIHNYYFHRISHHLGLDVHDPMSRNSVLEKNNVITNEPGLYFEELNIGVRIEDDLLITEDGCINLSKDIIKEIEDIENFMK